jgi:hypothetical protein
VDADYEIHVRGPIDANARLELAPVREAPVAESTVLVCRAADPAEVHGLIARISALGLELIEVRRLAPSGGRSVQQVLQRDEDQPEAGADGGGDPQPPAAHPART